MNGRGMKSLLAGPKRYSLPYPAVKCRDRNTTRLDSPDRESYAGKYPREAKVEKCQVQLRLSVKAVKEREKEEDGKSNVTADYLKHKVYGLLLPQLCVRTELRKPS
jgi:hypothetical protein